MTADTNAIARLEVQVSHLLAAAEKRDRVIERIEFKNDAMMQKMAGQIDTMQAKLDQSAGGIAVLRWIGLGSLGSAIAVTAAIYAWIKAL